CTPPALFDDALFFLVGRGVAPGSERLLPDQLRVAAPEAMGMVRNGFLRALPIEWEPRPPTGTPGGPGIQYYRLEKNGHFWDQIRAARSIAVHVLPPRAEGLSMQLIAVRQKR